jgi:hypothetical protein
VITLLADVDLTSASDVELPIAMNPIMGVSVVGWKAVREVVRYFLPLGFEAHITALASGCGKSHKKARLVL